MNWFEVVFMYSFMIASSRNIIPIYKNKGDSNDPKNFRPITLVSCLGKLFTAILSESKYSDDFFVMHENQHFMISSFWMYKFRL
jgi:hypothetical protein